MKTLPIIKTFPLMILSISLLLSSCSSDEPQEVELILPTKYDAQNENSSSETNMLHQRIIDDSIEVEEKAESINTMTITPSTPSMPPVIASTASAPKPERVKTAPPTPPKRSQKPSIKRGIVINVKANDTLNVRAGVGTDFRVVQTLKPGESVTVSSERKKPKSGKKYWVKITTSRGIQGWVNSHFIRSAP